MHIVVKKFGGTSLANIDCIHHVANIVHQAVEKGESCVVVVSAMAGITNQLEHWAYQVGQALGSNPERDMVLSSGEMVTAGLLSMALQMRQIKSRAWTGAQLPIITTENWGNAEAIFTESRGLLADLEQGIIPVVCGFQGVTQSGRLTTLGRGGSDTTAVILAATVKAKICEIFTDVQGVYSADPAYVKNAFSCPSLSYDNMLMLSLYGAKVLHSKAIDWAKKHHIPMHVLSTMKADQAGTMIVDNAPHFSGIVYRPVLSWKMDCLPMDSVSSHHFSEPILDNHMFVDWHVSAKGVHFVTWTEDYHHIRSLWPSAICSDPKMLITYIGQSPLITKTMTDHESIRAEHCIHRPGMTSIVIEENQAYDMVRHAHTHLELYAKSQ